MCLSRCYIALSAKFQSKSTGNNSDLQNCTSHPARFVVLYSPIDASNNALTQYTVGEQLDVKSNQHNREAHFTFSKMQLASGCSVM